MNDECNENCEMNEKLICEKHGIKWEYCKYEWDFGVQLVTNIPKSIRKVNERKLTNRFDIFNEKECEVFKAIFRQIAKHNLESCFEDDDEEGTTIFWELEKELRIKMERIKELREK